jgi:hypothetical protein
MFGAMVEFEVHERVRHAHREAERYRQQSGPRESRVRWRWWRRGESAGQVSPAPARAMAAE